MSVLVAMAPGKVNRCLLVGAPRSDGLHPLVSLVQPLSLADTLRLEPAPAGALEDEVLCAGVRGPNLAALALARFRERSGWDGPPQRLTIDKRVPVAAGMGGGSADAAAALRLIAHAAGAPGSPLAAQIAPTLGADVPAALAAGPVLMTGIGERVSPIMAELPPITVLVVPSPHGLSTPAVYAEADRLGLGRSAAAIEEAAASVAAMVSDGGPPTDGPWQVNDLAPAARNLLPTIDLALEALATVGADTAMVSGSGPTCFGVFSGAEHAERAQAAFERIRPEHPAATLAVPVGPDFAAVRQVA